MLDVLLQSDSDAMLPRMGLSVMEALSRKLLELDDFEELITYLKVSVSCRTVFRTSGAVLWCRTACGTARGTACGTLYRTCCVRRYLT